MGAKDIDQDASHADGHAADVRAFLSSMLDDADAAWSLGGFGAVAEFRRSEGEEAAPLEDGRLGRVTGRGAIALDPAGVAPIAYETAFVGGWSHAVALCLPADACLSPRRRVLTELGPDAQAARAADRGAILFDLGLGLPQADILCRAGDPETLAMLRAACGAAPGQAAHPLPVRAPAMRVDWVVTAPPGRIEAFHPHGSADGPRVVIAMAMIRPGRTHAATAPIPAGLIPCAHLHPAHPAKDASGRPIPFRRDRHDAFQALYARWGDPGHVALKTRSVGGPVATGDRRARMVAKVALAQAEAMAGA